MRLPLLSARWGHSLYLCCVLISALTTYLLYRNQGSWPLAVEITGTFVQIALPCYALVPLWVRRDKAGLRQFLLFLCATLTLVYLLKYTVPIKRPYGGSMSFPSGHTAGAFIGVVFLWRRYGTSRGLIALPAGCFVGVSRIYSQNHWPSDVLAAIVITTVLGYLLVKKRLGHGVL